MNREIQRFECHGHMVMDGMDFAKSRDRHVQQVDRDAVECALSGLQRAGVCYYRDGGDAQGVSLLARQLAPDYGMEFVTPGFAIHRKGYYGGLVGRGYADETEYRLRLSELRALRGDFVKLMVSGMITFKVYGQLSCDCLPTEEIAEIIRIAHAEGYAVMLHVNGDEAIRAVVDAGGDSIEHGYFMSDETLRRLADSDTIWVPTLAAVDAFVDRPGFNGEIAQETVLRQMDALSRAAARGAKIASGSDSGAVGVAHGAGTLEEYRLLEKAGVSEEKISWANELLRARFRRQN